MIRKWIARMIETEVERRMEDLERVDPYEVAEGMDASDVARHMDVNEVAGEFDMYEVAQNIEPSAIADYVNINSQSVASAMYEEKLITNSEVADEICMDGLAEYLAEYIIENTTQTQPIIDRIVEGIRREQHDQTKGEEE
jgi:hypothetical protein